VHQFILGTAATNSPHSYGSTVGATGSISSYGLQSFDDEHRVSIYQRLPAWFWFILTHSHISLHTTRGCRAYLYTRIYTHVDASTTTFDYVLFIFIDDERLKDVPAVTRRHLQTFKTSSTYDIPSYQHSAVGDYSLHFTPIERSLHCVARRHLVILT
jgi:hypothetical protein